MLMEFNNPYCTNLFLTGHWKGSGNIFKSFLLFKICSLKICQLMIYFAEEIKLCNPEA